MNPLFLYLAGKRMSKYAINEHRKPRNNDTEDPIAVRTFTQRDATMVERLSREGLLPGLVGCDPQHSGRAAQSYLASTREHFWVAEVDRGLIGTVALAQVTRDISCLHCLRVAPPWQADGVVARRLVGVATAHARAVGFLKLILEAPPTVQPQVVSYFGLLGFQFSRTREVDGKNNIEFYVNLYQRPQLPPE